MLKFALGLDPCKLEKARWFKMVRARFWSTFSHFSDEELEQGIAELDLKFTEVELRFNDVLVFVTAKKR